MVGLIKNEIPTSLEPLAELTLGSRTLSVAVTQTWYQFFQALSQLVQNIVGGVLAFTTETGLIATGTTQANALQLASEWNVVATAAANTGVKLKNVGAGVPTKVFNRGANAVKVYPPLGAKIDALATNAAYSLPASKNQNFSQVSATQWYSDQLG